MTRSLGVCAVLGVTLLVAATSGRAQENAAPAQADRKTADPSAATPRTDADNARCAVWARELGFAKSVSDHDAKAFAEFVHADAVFGVGGEPTRGRDAISTQWAGLIAGTRLELQWYPDRVSVGGDGRTAYSSGPALYRSTQDGSYRVGRFGSVWQRDHDGQWRVIFDDGITPVATDAAGVQAFQAGRQLSCPATG